MPLDYRQKQYIKKKLRKIPLAEIAENIEVSEEEILEYLKKKWPKEKYEKFLESRINAESSSEDSRVSFNFFNFLSENRMPLIFLAFLVLAVYANSFGNGFVSDDVAGFARNENIGKISNFTANAMHFSLTGFFQTIAFYIGGMHPITFRIINIFSHLGSVVLIYMLLSLSMNRRVGIIAAAIFAVHPILTESVSWISGGLYSMYAFFFLLSFLFYLFSKNNKKYFFFSVIFFILAIFSSEKALALALVFAIYEFVFGSLRNYWKKLIPFFSISLFFMLLFVSKIGSRVSDVESMSYQQGGGGMYNPFVQIPVAVGSYLKLIFWPARLTLYQTEMSFSQGQFLALLFIFFVFAGLAVWGYFKNKTVFFWLVFFVVTLLPTLTPFKISWLVAERYVYLGTLGIIVPIALLFDKLIKINENGKMVGYFVLILVVASLSVRTVVRNQDWKSEDTLWLATAEVAPSGQQIHNNLGDVYARQGDMQKAVDEFKKAIEINPNYADAYHNLANTYQQMGQNDLAVENYQKALSINPHLWQSYQNLASIYFNAGDSQKAEENMKKALELNPGDQKLEESLKYIQENRK
jgi:protein O-mannosyl-transferase